MKFCKTLSDVMTANGSFMVYLEFTGSNHANVSGSSHKFYCAQRTGKGLVSVTFGKIGTAGQTMSFSLEEAYKKLKEKINKGYRFKSPRHPYKPLRDLPAPMNEVVHIERDGLRWKALNAQGELVMLIPENTVHDLLHRYGEDLF